MKKKALAIGITLLALALTACADQKKDPEQTTTGSEAETTLESSQTEASDAENSGEEDTTEWTEAESAEETAASTTAEQSYAGTDLEVFFYDYTNVIAADGLDVWIHFPYFKNGGAERTATLEQGALNDYGSLYVLKNLTLRINSELTLDKEVISLFFFGTGTHPNADSQYDRDVVVRYGFTMNRVTGQVLTIDEVAGYDNVVQALAQGEFQVAEDNGGAMSVLSNADLSAFYKTAPAIAADALLADPGQRTQDFYIRGDALYVIVTVGYNLGSYVVLQMDLPLLIS